MNPKQLFTDDDAVSPVIGVILMVAITVILAAVIAQFVIGLGGDQTTRPSATFSADFETGGSGVTDDTVTISFQSGESLNSENIEIINTGWSTPSSGSEIGAGWSTGSVNVNGYPVEVVWNDPNSDQSFTLNSFDNPNE